MNCPYEDGGVPKTPQPMNDVLKGYKQTGVGVIPEDWVVRRIGELGKVVRGGSPRPAGDSRYFNGSFIPWLTVAALTNISEHQLHVGETVGSLTEEGSKRSRILHPKTLIVANSGATLGVAKLLQLTCCANDGIAALISQTSGDKAFICYYINTQTKRLREVVATGNGQPNLNTRLIGNIAIPFPCEREQRAIASALSDVDALIAKLDRLISKKRDLKQAAMQELLTGRRRLPGFAGGWGISTVGAEFDVKLGKMLDGARNVGVPKPYLGNKAVQWGRIDTRDLSTVPLSRQEIESLRLYKGDLLVCEGGEIGRAAIWMAPIDECYYQKALHRLRARRGFKPELMACFLRRWADSGLLANYATQTSIAHLPREKLLQIPLPVPTQQEQTAIAAVLSDMDAEITALEARRDKTKLLKQGVMQELLTGRIRLV